jgi:hypothetical protein
VSLAVRAPCRELRYRDAEDIGQSVNLVGGEPEALGSGSEKQLGGELNEPDPDTWYGLVWRIVRTAMESNANLIRVCILLVLVCAALWLVASIMGK